MAPTAPTPATVVLRFKNRKSTTMLHADPMQSFDTLKAELLRALRDTHPDGKLNGEPIPTDPSHILLARPNDVHNIEKGFTSVTGKDGAVVMTDAGTGKKGKRGDSELKLYEANAKAAGLKDGGVVAYKFKTDQDEDYDLALDDNWDVTMPSYEDEQ